MEDLVKKAHLQRRQNRLISWTMAAEKKTEDGADTTMKPGRTPKNPEHKSSTDEISGYAELVGFLADLPSDPSGLFDMVVSKGRLESPSLSNAKKYLAECDSFFVMYRRQITAMQKRIGLRDFVFLMSH